MFYNLKSVSKEKIGKKMKWLSNIEYCMIEENGIKENEKNFDYKR